MPMKSYVTGRNLADWAFLFFYRREANMSNHSLRHFDEAQFRQAFPITSFPLPKAYKGREGSSRIAKVLVVLLVSMTTGAVVLMALGNHPPSAGPFCLSTYYRLDPVREAISSRIDQSASQWECVEVYYSGTKAGNIDQLASLSGLASSDDINCHFVVCNGLGGSDGQIQASEKWQQQWSVIPDHTWYGSSRIIRICLVADGKSVRPTNSQIKRTEALVESLVMRFNVPAAQIFYPANWR
jgi:hypothetical protein